MHNYYYEIYQVKAKEDFAFVEWDWAKRFNWSFKPYKIVWADFEDAKDDYDFG